MANRRLPMRKIKEILRLHFQARLSARQIARSCSVSRATVGDYLSRTRARADGTLHKRLAKLARVDILIVDDFAMTALAESERRDFLEICEDRYNTRSTILTSQIPIADWHQQIGDPTLADSILDRLVHNAHRLQLAGGSMRKRLAASQD